MINKVFLDTKVVMDLPGERLPFYDATAKIATIADKGQVQLYVSGLTYSIDKAFL